jgi:hypothetical protein
VPIAPIDLATAQSIVFSKFSFLFRIELQGRTFDVDAAQTQSL